MSSALQKMAPLASRLVRQRAATVAQRRGFAADAHGEVKVNFWEAPLEVAKWKEEQTVLVVLACWGIGITSAIKIFGGKKDETPAPTQA